MLYQAPRRQVGHGWLGAQGPFPSADLPALGRGVTMEASEFEVVPRLVEGAT